VVLAKLCDYVRVPRGGAQYFVRPSGGQRERIC
jgi:hypothetical protein